MSEDSRKDTITVRVLRNGEPEPPDNDWAMATMEERIEGVGTLTSCVWPGTTLQVNPNFKELLLA